MVLTDEVSQINKIMEEFLLSMTKNKLDLEMIYDKAYALMDVNISKKMETDRIYHYDEQSVHELEAKCEALPLTNQYKWILQDYYACMHSKMARVMELAYLAGIEVALSMIIEEWVV